MIVLLIPCITTKEYALKNYFPRHHHVVVLPYNEMNQMDPINLLKYYTSTKSVLNAQTLYKNTLTKLYNSISINSNKKSELLFFITLSFLYKFHSNELNKQNTFLLFTKKLNSLALVYEKLFRVSLA